MPIDPSTSPVQISSESWGEKLRVLIPLNWECECVKQSWKLEKLYICKSPIVVPQATNESFLFIYKLEISKNC